MIATHVPPPWVLGGSTVIMANLPDRDTPVFIATLQRGVGCAANAEFILRAVNNHGDLVALLRQCLPKIEEMFPNGTLRIRIHNALIEADGRA